ncbi:hypothetical protein D3C85_1160100 [compost metagenome]
MGELSLQGIDGDGLEHCAISCSSRVVTQTGNQRQQQRATANAPGVDNQRGDQPGILNPLGEQTGKHRTPRIAVFQLRQAIIKKRAQTHRVNVEASEDVRHIGIGIFQQLTQHVLQGNLVMSARQGQPRRVFQSLGAVNIEPGEQRFEFYLNHLSSPLLEHWSVFGRKNEYNFVLRVTVAEPGIEPETLPSVAQGGTSLFIGRKAHHQSGA